MSAKEHALCLWGMGGGGNGTSFETVAMRIRHLDYFFTYICIEKHNKNPFIKKKYPRARVVIECLYSSISQIKTKQKKEKKKYLIR